MLLFDDHFIHFHFADGVIVHGQSCGVQLKSRLYLLETIWHRAAGLLKDRRLILQGILQRIVINFFKLDVNSSIRLIGVILVIVNHFLQIYHFSFFVRFLIFRVLL